MAITNAQAAQINKMNRASQKALLGTVVQGLQGTVSFSGSRVVTAQEVNGSRIIIVSGIPTVSGFFVNVDRSGSPISVNSTAGSVAGTIEVRRATNYVGGSAIALGDRVSYMGFA